MLERALLSLMVVAELVGSGILTIATAAPVREDVPDCAEFLPDGYQVDQAVRYDGAHPGHEQFVAAISDHVNLDQPLMLLYVEREGTWKLKDKVLIHPGASRIGGAAFDQPNYYGKLSIQPVGSHRLILFESIFSGGGSGADFVFDFYQIRRGRLVLVKAFHHVRMEQTYFCVDQGAVYDATFHDIKGPKVGRSFVHTYYLDVVKYTFDGADFVAAGHERLREKQGNWTKADDYRFVSVCKAVRSGEVFGATRR